MAKEQLIQNVVMARKHTREGPWGPWHVMGDWNTALCGKADMTDWKRIGRFSHCNTGKVCHTCWHAMKNHRNKIATMVTEWDQMKKDRKTAPPHERAAMDAVCILCRPEKQRSTPVNENGIPFMEKGWRLVGYTDGDQYAYCPNHSPEAVLQDIMNRSDQEIGLYCGIERVYGFGESRRCAHLDLYHIVLDDKDTIAMDLPMSMDGAIKFAELKRKDYPDARPMPCTVVCNFCEYGYPK